MKNTKDEQQLNSITEEKCTKEVPPSCDETQQQDANLQAS